VGLTGQLLKGLLSDLRSFGYALHSYFYALQQLCEIGIGSQSNTPCSCTCGPVDKMWDTLGFPVIDTTARCIDMLIYALLQLLQR
jgi:hypothetical protein